MAKGAPADSGRCWSSVGAAAVLAQPRGVLMVRVQRAVRRRATTRRRNVRGTAKGAAAVWDGRAPKSTKSGTTEKKRQRQRRWVRRGHFSRSAAAIRRARGWRGNGECPERRKHGRAYGAIVLAEDRNEWWRALRAGGALGEEEAEEAPNERRSGGLLPTAGFLICPLRCSRDTDVLAVATLPRARDDRIAAVADAAAQSHRRGGAARALRSRRCFVCCFFFFSSSCCCFARAGQGDAERKKRKKRRANSAPKFLKVRFFVRGAGLSALYSGSVRPSHF